MAGERDRVRSSRLKRFVAKASVLLLLGIGIAAYSYQRLTSPRDLVPNKSMDTNASSVSSHQAASDEANAVADKPINKSLETILELAQSHLENMNKTVLDYTARLEKQERVDGQLGEAQFMELKVLSRTPRGDSQDPFPLHAYFRYVEPSKAAGREVIWVENRNDGKLVAHEAGFMNVMRVNLAPTSFLAMKGNKYPASQIGLENLLRKLIEKGMAARSIESCEVTYEQGISWEGRNVDRLVVVFPYQTFGVDFHRAVILLDTELKLPVSYESYLWPEPTSREMPLEERYVYHDLRVNVGLTETDFDPDNPAYNFP